VAQTHCKGELYIGSQSGNDANTVAEVAEAVTCQPKMISAGYIEPETVAANMLYVGLCIFLLSAFLSFNLFLFGQEKNSFQLKIWSGVPLLLGVMPLVRAIIFLNAPAP